MVLEESLIKELIDLFTDTAAIRQYSLNLT